MALQTQTRQETISMNLTDLPILKHFDKNEIVTKVDNFRKSEKNIFWFLKLVTIIGLSAAIVVYALPPIFTALGTAIGYVITAAVTIGSIVLLPQFFKLLRVAARKIDRALIAYDPFGELAEQRINMVNNQTTFRTAKGTIKQIQQDMEIEARNAEKDAEEGQADILRLQGKAAQIKKQMDAMIAERGNEAKSDDVYVEKAANLQKVLAEAQRRAQKLNQSKDFVQKYGTRANIMKKLNQKLVMVETAMDIKISDFDATVDMLKKDYEFGQKANQATSAANRAMGITKDWKLDYALDVITSTIAADIAVTAGNLKDIEALTANYTLDNDEMYANLDVLADKIKTGADIIPSAKQYVNPDYVFTASDREKSKGFDSMF